MNKEWISARKAADAMWPGRKPAPTPNAITRRAAQGMVKANADLLTKQGPVGITKAPNCSIPDEFWGGRAMIPNWESGDFSAHVQQNGWEEEWSAFGVTFEQSGIEAMVQTGRKSVDPLPPSTKEKSTNGRPTKHDWEGALIGVVALANSPDGLPTGYGAQAEIERMLALWFQNNSKKEPQPSELRLRAKRIMNEVELSTRSAGNPKI